MANPISLIGMVDTGSGESIITFSAFNCVVLQTDIALQFRRIDSYGANGRTIKTFEIAERVRLQLGGYEIETNFVFVDDAHGLEDFLLCPNFLKAYNLLVDLTSMIIVVWVPAKQCSITHTPRQVLYSTVVLD